VILNVLWEYITTKDTTIEEAQYATVSYFDI
jgi:hypothetical protein